jgi:hypothetical protein
MADYSYIGSGKAYLREVGSAAGLVEVGNCSALNFSVTEESKELKDYTQPGGGTYNEVKRISAVEMAMTMHDLSPENLARALYGSTSAVATGTVTDEVHTAYDDTFIPFDFIPAASPAPVVKDTATGLITYVEGTDYEVRPGGIFVLGTGTIVSAADLDISYTKAASDVVEALTASGKEYELVFDGLNEARSGKKTMITAHRVKIGAAQNLSMIGEDYAALEVTGKLLKDSTKNGTSISQYFKVAIEQ